MKAAFLKRSASPTDILPLKAAFIFRTENPGATACGSNWGATNLSPFAKPCIELVCDTNVEMVDFETPRNLDRFNVKSRFTNFTTANVNQSCSERIVASTTSFQIIQSLENVEKFLRFGVFPIFHFLKFSYLVAGVGLQSISPERVQT